GEEGWREILEGWLPAGLPIKSKGRILGIDGRLTPQIDIIILSPSYPPSLVNKKVYLAGGVVAAFECKLTLKKHHIAQAAATARILSQMGRATHTAPVSTPRRDLRS